MRQAFITHRMVQSTHAHDLSGGNADIQCDA
jgi:hypothetical protein